MPCAAECGQIGFQASDLGTVDELAMRQHPRNRIVDTFAETATLFDDITKRNCLHSVL
jgi:hypothetical protein